MPKYGEIVFIALFVVELLPTVMPVVAVLVLSVYVLVKQGVVLPD